MFYIRDQVGGKWLLSSEDGRLWDGPELMLHRIPPQNATHEDAYFPTTAYIARKGTKAVVVGAKPAA